MIQQPLQVTVISGEHVADLPEGPIVLRTHVTVSEVKPDRPADQIFNPTWSSANEFSWKSQLLDCLSRSARNNHVNYVVHTHPMLGDATVQYLLQEDESGTIELELFDEPLPFVLTEVLASVDGPPAFVDVLAFAELDIAAPFSGGRWPASTNQAVIITNVIPVEHSSSLAGMLKRRYRPDTEIRLIPMFGKPRQMALTLGELANNCFEETCYLVLPVAVGDTYQYSADDLQRLVARLRAPGGCPWDREQTNLSLARNLVEETYEFLDAIEQEDGTSIREELGDYILQAWMHAQIAEESGQFVLEDVFQTLIEKLIRRHPHVFAATNAIDSDTVLETWDQIKRAERATVGSDDAASRLGDVPTSLPSLMRAQTLLKRADRAGYSPDELAQHAGLASSSFVDQPEKHVVKALIDVVQSARAENVDLEQALRNWTREFERAIESGAGPTAAGS